MNKPDYICNGECSRVSCKNKFGEPPNHGIRIGDEYVCQFHFIGLYKDVSTG